MKKVICLATLLVFVLQASADSVDPIRRALYEVAQHPKELTDSQATYLYLNPAVRDTVLTDSKVFATKFSITPFKVNWVNKTINSAIWYDNCWQRENNIILYSNDFMFIHFMRVSLIGLLVILILYTILDRSFFKKRVKSEAKDEKFGDVEREIKSYHYSHVRKRTIIFRKEIVWAALIFGLIGIMTQWNSNIWLYLTIGWWLTTVCLIAICVRNVISKKTYASVCKKYLQQKLQEA